MTITTKKFFNLSLLLLCIGVSSGTVSVAATAVNSSPKTPKKVVAKTPTLTVNGKIFKIKSISRVSLSSESSVSRPPAYNLPEHAILKLPELLPNPSSPSPVLLFSLDSAKLPPLVRFSLKVTWIGANEPRLSPEWKSPGVVIPDPTLLPMESFTDGEFRILEALLLLKSNDTTPISIGLANPLLKDSETKSAANEILGRGLLSLGIRTAGLDHLQSVLKIEKETPRAKRSLSEALGALHANDFTEAQNLSSHLTRLNTPDTELGNLPLALARSALAQKDLQETWDWISRIPPESPQSFEGRFLKSMVLYRSNDVPGAQKELESLLRNSEKAPKDLKSLSAATLGQIYFQQGDYKKALATYKKVDQEHPVWMETLVESAWSQILNKDYEGAAGNMFSLHTNYFQGAYKPESYIVRTVSYLQLCQFGDALAVLRAFLGKYKYAQKQLQAYKKQKPNHLDIVRQFLKAGTPKSFAGLPRSLLVEIARDPKFIELQKKINEIEEDTAKMSQVLQKIDDLDHEFQQVQTKYTKLLQELEVHIKTSENATKRDSLLAEKQSHEKRIQKYTLLRQIIQDARQGVMNEEQLLTPLWTSRKSEMKNQQNLTLQTNFDNLEKDLVHWLDQSELLYYEIHNGAGEHLRYQMANADEANPADKKPAPKAFKKEDKDQQWAFDGEIWEDEVGNYRSSLKNVCPEDETTRVGERKSAKPAATADATNENN